MKKEVIFTILITIVAIILFLLFDKINQNRIDKAPVYYNKKFETLYEKLDEPKEGEWLFQ